MKPSIFLNDMLTKGAILGGVMLISNISEIAMVTYGKGAAWLSVFAIESIAFFALFIFLLYRFTRNYANIVVAERKEMPYFTYGNGLSYASSISALAGVIVALGGYIFTHYIVGYEVYIEGYISLMQDVLSTTEIPASMVGQIDQMFKTIREQNEPTLISTILSGIWSFLCRGVLFGLIIAAYTKRAPKFDNQNEQ